jgi:hypothetical protein
MGDITAEPSMEEILSSIKRIIAEEGEGMPIRSRRPQRAAPPPPAYDGDGDEVLELREPIAEASPAGSAPAAPTSCAIPLAAASAEPIVSPQTAEASRGSLDALTRLVVRPDSRNGDNTLEGLVREMLRPMLREWLDAQLPTLVEAMVAREIERITTSS